MAQPSVAAYFNTRKRSAVDDTKLNQAKKVLVLDSSQLDKSSLKGSNTSTENVSENVQCKNEMFTQRLISANKIIISSKTSNSNKKVPHVNKTKKMKMVTNNSNIQELLNNMNNKTSTPRSTLSMPIAKETVGEELNQNTCLTPPSTPTKKINAMDKVKGKPDGPAIKEIRRKMSRSARLSELKFSLNRFQEGAKKLKEVEENTSQISESPKLKTFRTIELEVQTSPRKVFSPEKAYLSPKKNLSTRRNLFTSPTKSSVSALLQSPKDSLGDSYKTALKLPYKYRSIAEMFRAIDTVVQILFNRKEVITFRKLKPAVEELIKRNLFETHLAQIKHVYPDAFCLGQEKLKVFGSGMKSEQWELIIKPNIDDEQMTPEILLQRRRKMFKLLLDKVKEYHDEYLLNLPTPLHISKDKITRWHPEFDIERVPDIKQAVIPQATQKDHLTTGKCVLEKARVLFNCNTRMEQALERLKKATDDRATDVDKVGNTEMPTSILKGIPKALLERVRQKQAAKALVTITRSADKEKELQTYLRLPEIARLARNIFVSEKKSVLPLDLLVEKLGNCYRGNLSKAEMKDHLEVISKEVTGWLVFHDIRNCMYVKLLKNADLSLVFNKLENLIKKKSES